MNINAKNKWKCLEDELEYMEYKNKKQMEYEDR